MNNHETDEITAMLKVGFKGILALLLVIFVAHFISLSMRHAHEMEMTRTCFANVTADHVRCMPHNI